MPAAAGRVCRPGHHAHLRRGRCGRYGAGAGGDVERAEGKGRRPEDKRSLQLVASSGKIDGQRLTAFGEFEPSGDAALANDKRRLTVKMSSLQTAKEGLQEAIAKGFEVTSMGFSHIDTGVEFRLTEKDNLQ